MPYLASLTDWKRHSSLNKLHPMLHPNPSHIVFASYREVPTVAAGTTIVAPAMLARGKPTTAQCPESGQALAILTERILRKALTIHPRSCRSDAIIARVVSEKSESSFAFTSLHHLTTVTSV